MAEKLIETTVVFPPIQDIESPREMIERAKLALRQHVLSLESAGFNIDFIDGGKSSFIARDFGIEVSSLVSPAQIVDSREMRQAKVRQLQNPADVRETRIRELEHECQELKLEKERLQSRVAEERRATARVTRQYDQLLMEFNRLQQHNENLLSYSKERQRAVDTTTELLLHKQNNSLRIFERYEGIVEHVLGDDVTVVFEIDDDIVEHKYGRDQFIDRQLPNEGDRITVYVHVVHSSVATEDAPSLGDYEIDESDDERSRIAGPIEF
ncbi:MAG: hypothetical protein JNK57_04990 [Planctomycetaceae bacterium]|nr:hypothetical protein [Planctomycetaceae bacterium]